MLVSISQKKLFHVGQIIEFLSDRLTDKGPATGHIIGVSDRVLVALVDKERVLIDLAKEANKLKFGRILQLK